MSQAGTLSPTLKEQNITRNQSSNWQRIADIPEEQMEGKKPGYPLKFLLVAMAVSRFGSSPATI